MGVIDIVRNRRSCRIFQSNGVEQEKIEAMTKAALWSPTSKNSRPWEFIWVDDKALLSDLAKCKPHGAEFLANAPLALVIVADAAKSDVWVEDTAIAATLVQLAAEDLGLGSCWVQVRLRDAADGQAASDFCKKLLNVPDHFETASIIAIGYKQKDRKPYTDEQLLRDKVHLNGMR